MMAFINGFIIISLLTTALFAIGLMTFLTDYEESTCEMTYMFEYPQYVRISNEIDRKYPRYGLYAYSEGRLTEKVRNMKFDGIPVVFIPGNAGSHRQVRSLASIALRKSLNSRLPYHFDYFTIDLNDELSALNGALLFDQLEYVNSSIIRILNLYKSMDTRPRTVLLIGHSIGGVIAHRFVIQSPINLVSIVITLATPHQRVPIILDHFMEKFYENLSTTNQNTIFINLNGGYDDRLVPSYLSRFDGYGHGFDVVTTQIPMAWMSCDHLNILWCKQVILAINRALYDSVDVIRKQITHDKALILNNFRRHLIKHNGFKLHINTDLNYKKSINNDGEWIEYIEKQYTIDLPKGTKQIKWYMVRLVEHQPRHEYLTLVARNLEISEWIYVCGAHIPRESYRVCEEFTPLSHLSEIAPSPYKKRSIRLNMHDIKKTRPDTTHVVFRVLPTSDPVSFHVDVYNSKERRQDVILPHFWSLIPKILVEETPEKIIHYDLIITDLQHIIQSYYVYLEPLKCANRYHHSSISVLIPWDKQNYHKIVTESDKKPLILRLFRSKPANNNNSVIVRFSLDTICRFRISIRSSILGTLSQLARYYTPFLLVNVAVILLMTLKTQLACIEENNYCSIFIVALKEGAKPYYILPIVKLIGRLLSFDVIRQYLPDSDWFIMTDEGSDFFFLPPILYLSSVGIVWLIVICLGISLMISESTIHKLVTKFLAKTVSFNVAFSDWLINALNKLPLVVAIILISIALTTCGALALCLGTIFYFLKLTQLSQDYVEEYIWYIIRKFKKTVGNSDGTNEMATPTHNALFFHFTVFLMWTVVTIINLPSVLTWAHNFKYSTILQPDPSFYPGLILSICAIPLWQCELPKIDKKYQKLNQFIMIMATISLIYGQIHVYRLNYILIGVISVTILHQMYPTPMATVVPTDKEREEYEDIKTKLE